MKRLIIVGILSICLVALCIAGIMVAKNLTARFEDLTQSALDFAKKGNFEAAKQKIDVLNQKWTRYEPLLSVFFNSSSLHEIEKNIKYVETLAALKDGDFIPQTVVLKYNISRIRLDEVLTVESWF